MGVVANNPKVYDLVASSVKVEQLATGFTFTEGPVWHPDGYLLFSDMPMDVRRKWSEADGIVEVMKPANKCNGMTFDADLNLIVCEHWTSQVVRATLNADGTEASRVAIASHYDGKELNSPNDVVVKSDGSIYFSDPTYGRMDVLRQPARAGSRFPGRLQDPPGRRRRLTLLTDDFDAAERALLLTGRADAVRERLQRSCTSGASTSPDDGSISGGEVILDGIGDPDDFAGGICDGMKCDEERQHLGHRPGRSLGRGARRRAPRNRGGGRAHGQSQLGRPELERALRPRLDVRLPVRVQGGRQPARLHGVAAGSDPARARRESRWH